jgi:ornithine cyclodeaminase
MSGDDILILKGRDVLSLLDGREAEIIGTVRAAYEAHAAGDTSLPHSTFLRFPSEQRNRIIALPAYLGEEFGVAGIKWISSFPGNLERGLERASAVVILNSSLTGRPEAIIEGSIISAKRTAASAVLAAQTLVGGRVPARAGFLGCGLINFEIARFMRAALPEVKTFAVYDLSAERARHFARKCRNTFGDIEVEIADSVESLLKGSELLSFATTATQPHVSTLAPCAPGATVLHVSLRDLTPEVILSCDNVVDDVDHVCRAQTSVHLAEELTGGRDFIRCTLADILRGTSPTRRDPESVTVFSPFGLGILDLAVSKLARDLAVKDGLGSFINSFLPEPWVEGETSQVAPSVL